MKIPADALWPRPREDFMLAYVYVIFATILRLVPHPFSFTPVGASLLYFGARGPKKQMWVPVAILAASDLFLTLVFYRYAFTADHYFTWAWYAGAVLLGTLLRRNASVPALAGASLAASVSFFLVSNFAVWAVWPTYGHTLNGLWLCYAAGLPFFRNTVLSDLVFTAVMFGLPALATAMRPARQTAIS